MTTPLTEQQLDEIEARASGLYEYATGLDDAWQVEADQLAGTDVPALLAEVRRLRFRIAELGEQGPGDRETVDEAAQMYRSLRTTIERTMAEPDRWDGDEDESFHLGRYVEWLAAGQPDDDGEPDTLPAWLYQRFMPAGEGWDSLDDGQRSYWEHQARAVRRAVARDGFKTATPAAAGAGVEPGTRQ